MKFKNIEEFEGLEAKELVKKMSSIVFGYTERLAHNKELKEDCLFSKYNYDWKSFYADFKREYLKRLDEEKIQFLSSRKIIHIDESKAPTEPERNFKRYVQRHSDDRNYNPNQLKEFIIILVALYQNFVNKADNKNPTNQKTAIHTSDMDFRNPKKEIELLFHLFLDTGLPLYFYQGLSRDLYIHLKETDSWSIDLDSFESGYTDIILHSFSHAVALNKKSNEQIIFFPLFEFQGYSLVIKNEPLSIPNNKPINVLLRSNKWFEELQKNGHKFHIEKETDLYWVAFSFFKEKTKNQLKDLSEEQTLDLFEKHIIDSNDIQKFINDKESVILSTNNLFASFFKQKDIKKDYTVIEGKRFFEHNNLNGFIFTKTFARENPETIKILIDNWYKQIQLLKKTYERIIEIKSRHDIPDDTYMNPFDNYCKILNAKYAININRQQMASSLKFQNNFFENIIDSSSSFNSNVKSSLENYLELCKINYEKFKDLSHDNSNVEMGDLLTLIEESQIFINEIKK